MGTVPTAEDREMLEQVALAQPGIDSLVLAVDVAGEESHLVGSAPLSVEELTTMGP